MIWSSKQKIVATMIGGFLPFVSLWATAQTPSPAQPVSGEHSLLTEEEQIARDFAVEDALEVDKNAIGKKAKVAISPEASFEVKKRRPASEEAPGSAPAATPQATDCDFLRKTKSFHSRYWHPACLRKSKPKLVNKERPKDSIKETSKSAAVTQEGAREGDREGTKETSRDATSGESKIQRRAASPREHFSVSLRPERRPQRKTASEKAKSLKPTSKTKNSEAKNLAPAKTNKQMPGAANHLSGKKVAKKTGQVRNRKISRQTPNSARQRKISKDKSLRLASTRQ